MSVETVEVLFAEQGLGLGFQGFAIEDSARPGLQTAIFIGREHPEQGVKRAKVAAKGALNVDAQGLPPSLN